MTDIESRLHAARTLLPEPPEVSSELIGAVTGVLRARGPRAGRGRRRAFRIGGLAACAGVLMVAGLASAGVSLSERTREIFHALGVDQRASTGLTLSGYSVRYVPHPDGDMVLVEGVEGTRGTVAVGCAARPLELKTFVCGTIQPEGTPAIAIGRAAPNVASVEARFAGVPATRVSVDAGLFLIKGPTVSPGAVRGELPTSLAALDTAGKQIFVGSAVLGGG